MSQILDRLITLLNVLFTHARFSNSYHNRGAIIWVADSLHPEECVLGFLFQRLGISAAGVHAPGLH